VGVCEVRRNVLGFKKGRKEMTRESRRRAAERETDKTRKWRRAPTAREWRRRNSNIQAGTE
jgi:hypothetical protein